MNVSANVEGGTTAVGGTDNPCKELDDRNKNERELAEEGLCEAGGQAQYLQDMEGIPAPDYHLENIETSLAKLQGEHQFTGMTFSTAQASIQTGNGNSITQTMSACSDAKTAECTNGSLLDGGESDVKDMRDGKKNVLCSAADFKHLGSKYGGHAEAKIFNKLTALAQSQGGIAGGSITFGTDWRHKVDGQTTWESVMPCKTCFKMMCAAAKKCNLKIYICSGAGKPEEFDPEGKCDESTKDPAQTPYSRLAGRLGEPPGLGHTKH